MGSKGANLFDCEIEKGATFSECRLYRWNLWRCWDKMGPPCVFIGLNPSTADERIDDPTIRRCIAFAMGWGYGGLVMLNAYGWRATDPKDMKAQADPIGEYNDSVIQCVAEGAVVAGGIVIAAWGAHCTEQRERDVCRLIDRPIHCLGRTKAGRPKHPLYLRADSKPELFWPPAPA